MKPKNSVRITNRLFFKVYINYALILTLFGGLLGLIYMNLYEDNIIDNYENTLRNQATNISRRLTATILNGDEEGYLEYIELISELDPDNIDIWTISYVDSQNPMSGKLENNDITNLELPEDFMYVLDKAFHNQINFKQGYYEAFGGSSLMIGVPVLVNGEVVGAVVLISQIIYQRNVINDSMQLIYTSIVFALGVSFLVAFFFARGLSSPISKMRKVAIGLTSGKYESKTEIIRKDEIGDLAKSIDLLADELKENEIERNNREQVRVDFFANVSHELRTPLTVIRAYTESIVDGVVEGEKAGQYLDRVLAECKGMERLVGDLLALSKMQNPDFVIEKEPVNLSQIFDDLSRNMQAICTLKNIDIMIEKDNGSHMMMGDYDRLRQMFLIILDNAIKFSKENSEVRIILRKKDMLRVSIIDEGVGISEEELGSIFDKFYKSKLKQNQEGSGLGLAICKQIAMKHEGQVEVYSSLGIGTEFEFKFQGLENFIEDMEL